MDRLTHHLSAFARHIELANIPADVRHQAKRTLLNYFGCACGGAGHEAVEAVVRGRGPMSGPAVATVIGRNLAVDAGLAALLNGMSSAVYSFDDTHAEAIVHPGGPVASSVLALAQQRRSSGRELLRAFIAGAEIVCRLSKSISVAPAQARPEWVQTGICAGAGAAAGAARLLDLDERKTTSAIGIAACRASGFRGLSRSMCFSYMAGSAAEAGVTAALLAQSGMIGPDEPLGGQDGFLRVFSGGPDAGHLLSDLGTRFELAANTFKPYPCGVVIHPIVDACLALAEKIRDPSDIDQVVIEVNPAVERLASIPDPSDQFEGQMSLQHWAACALALRSAGVAQTKPESLGAGKIAALRRLVRIEANPATSRIAASVRVQMHSGAELAESVAECRGSSNHLLTDAELEVKYFEQATPVIGRSAADGLARACWDIEDLADASVLMRLAQAQ